MFSVLCNQIDDLTGVAVTADAMHCQKAHADYLVLESGRRLHPDGEELPARAAQPTLYPFPGKRSRPGTPPSTAAIDEWSNAPTKSPPSQMESCSRTQCRPIQIVRKSRKIKGMKSRTEVVYAVTSEPAAHTTAAGLATWIRGHRCVENRLRWVRDVTSGEDRSPVRTARPSHPTPPLGPTQTRCITTHQLKQDFAQTLGVPAPDLASLDHAVLAQRQRGPLA
jgi:predicted transposase YbfD/YdcC